ncbi:MAG TPA: HEAT repeat domain-containing protein [Gammaproteobacteria bacterium]|jgi:hypothetical protein|nr:HEAT repeat domain-containing protein [Gammaproteobacteria bacterium]
MIFNTISIPLVKKILLSLAIVSLACGCSEQSDNNNNISDNTPNTSISNKVGEQLNKNDALPITENKKENQTNKSDGLQKDSLEYIKQEKYFDALHSKITSGTASFKEIRQALSDRNIAALTNTVHALYSMRIHRHVHKLLYDMWDLKKEKHPDLSWDLIAKAPTRIALASTISRIQISETHEYKNYIRSHKYDEHEFHRAQVVVSLGLNGDPVDVPYLKEMAESNNTYVVQSAITGLAFMNNIQARDALVEVWKNFQKDTRADLILDVLAKAYDWVPVSKNNS